MTLITVQEKFNADIYLESDINGDQFASASGSFLAVNYVTVDYMDDPIPPYVSDSFGYWGLTLVLLIYNLLRWVLNDHQSLVS